MFCNLCVICFGCEILFIWCVDVCVIYDDDV